MKFNFRVFIITALVLFVGIIAVILLNNKQKEDGKVFKVQIACNVPMTGDLSFYGECITNGVSMAMDELTDSLQNQSMSINYDFQDNSCIAKNAISAFNRQKISKFDIYVSGVNNTTVAILDLVKATNKPHFIYSFLPFQISTDDNLYRPFLDMEFEGKCMTKYIAKMKPKTVAFIYQNILSTNAQFETIIKPYVNKNNINVVIDECYDVATTDFKNIITKVKNANPDLIVVYGFKNHLIEIIKGLNTNGIKKKGNVICSFDFLDVQPIMDASQLDGIVTNVPQYIINNIDRVKRWRELFYKKYNRRPIFIDAYAYDMAYTFYYSMKKKMNNPNMSFDECLNSIDFDGITGRIHYLDNGQLKYNVQPCIYIDGEYQFLDIN